MNTSRKNPILVFILLTLSLIFAIACNPTSPPSSSPTTVPPTPQNDDNPSYPPPGSGYPESESAQADGSGYVDAEPDRQLLDAPPSPDIEMPALETGGAVSGILVREFVGEGYLPLSPKDVFLGIIVYDSNGDPALFRRGDDAPRAQVFPSGIFIFNNVQPDDYAIIIDVGFAQFPLLDENGDQIVVTVNEGESINLEQIFVDLPEE